MYTSDDRCFWDKEILPNVSVENFIYGAATILGIATCGVAIGIGIGKASESIDIGNCIETFAGEVETW